MSRLEKISAMIKGKGFDAVLLTGQENLQYATTFPHLEGFAVITKEGKGYCYTDSRYIEDATAIMGPLGYKVVQPESSYPTFETPQEIIDKCGIKTLAFEDLLMPVRDYNRYKEALSAELVPVGNAFEELREVKDASEIALLVEAQRIAESSLSELLPMIKPGAFEDELAAELEYIMKKKGSEAVSFSTILLSGARTSMPHGKPSHKAVEAGDFVTIDFGAKKGGYGSDMTRTFAVGYADEEMKKIYAIVLEAQLAGIEALAVGKAGREVDKAARDVITKAGYGQYFRHGLGHSLGLNIHENPKASALYEGAFKTGNVITIEPGIYIPGKGGVRTEDMLYLSPEGKVNLTNFPKELRIL
ncbi:MAG: Xaa-Pro peptidase family protein [Clostridiaceae bacterium]|nr:Xaa-Pro peptidase family protein [Clostridiaceae bacterium]